MKPAIIDLDEIERILKELKAEAETVTPLKAVVYHVAAKVLLDLKEKQCSQSVLIELLKAAIEHGVVFGMKNSENDSIDLQPAFHNFLIENNLTDETA